MGTNQKRFPSYIKWSQLLSCTHSSSYCSQWICLKCSQYRFCPQSDDIQLPFMAHFEAQYFCLFSNVNLPLIAKNKHKKNGESGSHF